MDYTSIGDRIRLLRNKHGLTQADLIEKMKDLDSGISRNKLSAIESRENIKDSWTLKEFEAICQILGCDMGYLLGAYESKTKEIQGLVEFTGLSPESAEKLIEWNEAEPEMTKEVDRLIKNKDILSQLYSVRVSSVLCLMMLGEQKTRKRIIEMRREMFGSKATDKEIIDDECESYEGKINVAMLNLQTLVMEYARSELRSREALKLIRQLHTEAEE